MMDHPNIARFSMLAQRDTGRPYFVMELVRGVKNHRLLRPERSLSPEARLNLSRKSATPFSMRTKGRHPSRYQPSNILSRSMSLARQEIPRSSISASQKPTSGERLDRQNRLTPSNSSSVLRLHESGAGGDDDLGTSTPARHLCAGRVALRTCSPVRRHPTRTI